VKNTPWKNGGGDVVREFTDACRKHGMKTGLYYSPAEHNYKERTAREYDDYFINQISELLTNYGKIDYLWFDGCGSEGHEYDQNRIISVIRGIQPDILIFNMWDPDVRWCGNESAMASYDNSNIVSSVDFSVLTKDKDELGKACFLPAECNCMMRENNWFYSDSDRDTVKSLDELLGLYYQSVGRGGNFLINIGPDRRGMLPDKDAVRLIELGDEIKRRFAEPVKSVFNQTGDGGVIKLEERSLVNHLVLGEDLTEGESVKEFKIFVKAPHVYNGVCIYEGKTIGHKRIVIFPAVNASELIVKITKSDGDFSLTKPEVYFVK
jgi:alpha-L-fucosidase